MQDDTDFLNGLKKRALQITVIFENKNHGMVLTGIKKNQQDRTIYKVSPDF